MKKTVLFTRAMLFCGILVQGVSLNAQTEKAGEQLPPVPEFPAIPEVKAENTVALGNSSSFAEVKLDLPITEGPFEPTWSSIEANYPGEPAWLRDAKFGIWVHFGPQAAGESGDWYARKLYYEGTTAYKNHKQRYGHPSQVGYKEVLRDWNPTKLDPDYLTKLYKKAGARFLMIQGVHHDNYDLWNSQYQPWNSVNIGPKRDLLGEWAKACKEEGMRYGVTFHHEYTWWWWQTAFASDKSGTYAGVPYDGNLTLEDGKGKWWEGYDPRLLYGINLREYKTVAARANDSWSPPDAGIFSRHLDYCKWYATQWALRMMDVTANYDPDFIYTDGTVQGPFTGNGTGTGYKCDAMQTVMADYYNRLLKTRGKVDGFSIIKFRSPTNGAVNTAEFGWPDHIDRSQPWIREAPVGDWFYAPGFTYDAGSVVHFIIESISRDGNAALNIPMKPDGSLEDACVTMLENVGKWMDINGQGVYGSKAWKTLGESATGTINTFYGGGVAGDVSYSPQELRFTEGADGTIYAFTMAVPTGGSTLKIKSLGRISEYYSGKVQKVTLLGYGDVEFENELDALTIQVPSNISSVTSAVFAITVDATPEKLGEVIQLYEEKLNEVKPLASYNTGKPNPVKIAAFAQKIEEARAMLTGSDEEQAAAIVSLRTTYAIFNESVYNKGGTPDDIGMTDITLEHLIEKNNFAATEMGSRFGKPVNWTVENYSIPQKDASKGTKNGIDNFLGRNTLMMGKWGDEDATPTSTDMTNARIFRKVHLPAGHYYFGATFNAHYNLGTSYIYVASEPLTTSTISSKAIARLPMSSCTNDGKFYGITFNLETEQDVVFVFQANMQGGNVNQEFRIDEVKLLYSTSTGNHTQTDITKDKLLQASGFSRKTGQSTSTRYGSPKNWIVENYTIPAGNDGTRNGLDRYPGYDCLTLGVWDDRQNNFEGDLTNARVYRKVNLDAGQYYFGAAYQANYQLTQAYIFAASHTLDTKDIQTQSIAFDPIADAGRDNTTFRGIYFDLDEPQDVLLGFQADLSSGAAEQEFRASKVKLLYLGESISGIDNMSNSLTLSPQQASNRIFNLAGQFVGTDLNKLANGIYIHGNKKVIKQ